MHANAGRYDPEVMKALKDLIGIENDYQVREVAVAGLRANMILDQDVWSLKGAAAHFQGAGAEFRGVKAFKALRSKFGHSRADPRARFRLFAGGHFDYG